MVNQMKEKLCYVALNFAVEYAKAEQPLTRYVTPDGMELEVDSERYEAAEVLFNPAIPLPGVGGGASRRGSSRRRSSSRRRTSRLSSSRRGSTAASERATTALAAELGVGEMVTAAIEACPPAIRKDLYVLGRCSWCWALSQQNHLA